MADTHRITSLLSELRAGNAAAEEELIGLIYSKLRAIAANRLREVGRSPTLQTTDLIHEAYLRLRGGELGDWVSRAHFYSVAATLMRHILVSRHRRRNAAKRGGGAAHLSLDEAPALATMPNVDWIWVDQCLKELGTIDAQAERVVELRHLAGLEIGETAVVLDVSRATVIRKWRFARAWLAARLTAGTDSSSGPRC